MDIAQVWKDTFSSSSPSFEAKTNKSINAHHAWMTRLIQRGIVMPDLVEEASWLTWMHDTAGTGLNENLSFYSLPECWFWLTNPKLCGLIMDGIGSPFVLRLFKGKRNEWEGAEQAIRDCNDAAKVGAG